jgi:low temperature requirement protein LtrA
VPQGEPVERDERETVVPLELFFDLVFVYAFTQVSTLLSRDPTWDGMLRAGLLLSMLWWAWSAYAWLTNTLDPEEGGVRIVMFAAIAAMLIASIAAPRAFGRDATIFAIVYLIVRALHLVLYTIAGRGDRELRRAVLRILPTVFLSGVLLLIASPLHGSAKLLCWAAAAAVDYLGPLVGHMRGWRLSPHHFVERFGQIVLIALGESVVAIGVGASGLKLGPELITAALLGITILACLWWSYFDWVVYVAQARLVAATGARRAALARDAYSYLHLP